MGKRADSNAEVAAKFPATLGRGPPVWRSYQGRPSDEARRAGFALCCAPTPSGHAAAAPPSRVMNSRRFILDMACAVRAAGFPALSAYHEGTGRSLGQA